jgi:hypothetical protein
MEMEQVCMEDNTVDAEAVNAQIEIIAEYNMPGPSVEPKKKRRGKYKIN